MKKVFLSSVAQGLEAHREAAYKAINGLEGYHCVRMEDFGARDAAPADLCQEKVRECDIFVGIIGPRYGSCPPDSDVSFTELEYDTARREGKRRLTFVAHNDFPLADSLRESDAVYARLTAFRNRALAERGAAFFTSEEELGRKVVTAIHNSQPTEPGFRAYCVPALVRSEGWTEIMGNVQITAFGLKRPEKVDVTLTIDTYMTNYYDASGKIDAIISSERRGVLGCGRRPDALNKVVFEGVPLDQQQMDGDETLSISGVRADAADAHHQVTAVLEVSSADAEKRELLRAPLVLALIPSRTKFAAARVRDSLASFVGQAPAEAKVRSYIVEFFGASPNAFKTREEEGARGGRPANHGTVLCLQAVIDQCGPPEQPGCRLLVTTRNLPPRFTDSTVPAGQAALVRTSATGVPGSTVENHAEMLWDGSIPMAEVENLHAAWEVMTPLGEATAVRFGLCVVGLPHPEGSLLQVFGGLGPFYSTAKAHLPSGSLPIPRFRSCAVSETLAVLSLD